MYVALWVSLYKTKRAAFGSWQKRARHPLNPGLLSRHQGMPAGMDEAADAEGESAAASTAATAGGHDAGEEAELPQGGNHHKST